MDQPTAWQGRAELVAQGARVPEKVELPWLAAWLIPDLGDALEVLDWLGDAERCIAVGAPRMAE